MISPPQTWLGACSAAWCVQDTQLLRTSLESWQVKNPTKQHKKDTKWQIVLTLHVSLKECVTIAFAANGYFFIRRKKTLVRIYHSEGPWGFFVPLVHEFQKSSIYSLLPHTSIDLSCARCCWFCHAGTWRCYLRPGSSFYYFHMLDT